MAATAQELLRIYGLQLRAQTNQHLEGITSSYIRTNSEALASNLGVSARTIRRHLTRLRAAGIIVEYHFRGMHRAYHLVLNNQFLIWHGAPTQPPEVSVKSGRTVPSNCPHIESFSLKTNLLIEVDKSDQSAVKPQSGSKTTPGQCSGYTTGNSPIYPAQLAAAEDTTGNVRARQQQEASAEASCTARPASLSPYVDSLWLAAKMSLYAGTWLSASQEQAAKNWLYKWYAPVPADKLQKVHAEYIERIGLVRQYLKRDARRYVQLPSKYFDPDFEFGFAATRAWLQKQRKRRQANQQQRIAHQELCKLQAAKTNRLRQYKASEATIRQLGSESLLESFYKQVAHLTQAA